MLQKIDKTFQEITGSRLNNVSQLKLFNILLSIEDNEKILNIFKSYSITDDFTASVYFDYYEIQFNDWLDNISYDFYETPNLWWIIAIINNIVNPFEELEIGNRLKILKQDYVYQVLKEIRNIGGL